jgi:hypothetical protein
MKKHNVSETGSVSVLRWGKTPILLGPLERANPNISVCYTPSSEPYSIYLILSVYSLSLVPHVLHLSGDFWQKHK